MKHILLALMLLFAVPFTSPAFAQKPGKGNAAKTEERSQHMAAILGLNDANAKRFVDLYTKYTAEVRAAHQKYRKIRPNKGQNGGQLTDQQIKTNTENQFALSQTILDIRKKYYQEYVKFLTARQIDTLYELEKKGGEHLREMARKRHGGGKGHPGGKPKPKGKGHGHGR